MWFVERSNMACDLFKSNMACGLFKSNMACGLFKGVTWHVVCSKE